ncbi:Type 1 glutamine amidotransferase-like domain-containing protein [Clavibacter michiganensis]|uniref:Type 1 glutamine amidotransferase-like domain-containing protein n=1 Tax=Clavibacter michiganensis TaxID=28447 RepID=UPI00142FAA6B|nr:Type 1 glutamine amidotransferase-like domain-containing protein [Clavibacter michiganensis]QIT11038.1 peptidase S51 [Clavibacter michiganensis subsp. michiganensis]
MSVHLVGGGLSDDDTPLLARFLSEATTRATDAARLEPARIAVVLVHDGLGAEWFDQYAAALRAAGACEPVAVLAPEGGSIQVGQLQDVDGIVVGGGLTPAYRQALEPVFGEIRRQVTAGVPYLGFSAGAAVAAETAIVGGWRIGDVEVVQESASEDLDEVTVEQGIGLIDVAVDVHAAQWGTLTRLIAATEAGLVEGGVAIDEGTVLIVGEGQLVVEGRGSVWSVIGSETGVTVSSAGAS